MGRGVDYLTSKEIELYKGDIEATEATLQAQQVIIANSLKNGIGDDIINSLNDFKTNKNTSTKKKTWFSWWRRK